MACKHSALLVFRVYYERPMVMNSLNLKLRQIARFLSNVILDEMSSAKCRLLFERRMTTLQCTCGNFWFFSLTLTFLPICHMHHPPPTHSPRIWMDQWVKIGDHHPAMYPPPRSPPPQIRMDQDCNNNNDSG